MDLLAGVRIPDRLEEHLGGGWRNRLDGIMPCSRDHSSEYRQHLVSQLRKTVNKSSFERLVKEGNRLWMHGDWGLFNLQTSRIFAAKISPPSEEGVVESLQEVAAFHNELDDRGSEVVVGDGAVDFVGEEG